MSSGTLPGNAECRGKFAQPSESTVPASPIGDLEKLLDNMASGFSTMKAAIDRYKGRETHSKCPHCGTPIRK